MNGVSRHERVLAFASVTTSSNLNEICSFVRAIESLKALHGGEMCASAKFPRVGRYSLASIRSRSIRMNILLPLGFFLSKMKTSFKDIQEVRQLNSPLALVLSDILTL